MAMTGSVYTVVAITIERYATLRQFRSRLLTTRFLIIFIIFFSVAFSISKFFELDAEIIKEDVDDLDIVEDTYYIVVRPTWLRTHPLYYLVYIMIINFLVMTLVPTLVLTILNFFIYKSVTRMTKNQSSNHSDTTMACIP